MATYAIGDVHGAHGSLTQLVDRLEFDTGVDSLWFVGDLVNRGPESLATLRFVRSLGESAITVLGNHDLSLLSQCQQPDAEERLNPTLQPILAAPDREPLLEWLRHRPLFHHDAELGWSMVHAGLLPAWDVARAAELAREVEAALRGPDYKAFLNDLFGNQPDAWSENLRGNDRLRVIVNAMTRMRFCQDDGRMDLGYKKTIAEAPAGLMPWFQLPRRASAGERIVFGHWSALGQVAWPDDNVWGIDTGCAWGNKLTALRLDTPAPDIIQVDCGAESSTP